MDNYKALYSPRSLPDGSDGSCFQLWFIQGRSKPIWDDKLCTATNHGAICEYSQASNAPNGLICQNSVRTHTATSRTENGGVTDYYDDSGNLIAEKPF